MLSTGLVLILAGVLIYTQMGVLIAFMPWLFGFGMLLGGIVKFQGSLDLRRMGYAHWYWSLIGAAVSILLGVLIVGNPFAAGVVLMQFIGASLLIEAAQDVVYAIRYGRLKKRFFQDFTGK
jgi:uncharacterized membrane protein HdeD (DUF308 family)